jgi:RNA polymerase sigma-70 factor (ECF subfamily)
MKVPTMFEIEAIPELEALRQFSFRLCRDEQRSQDLVQETLLKACRYFHTYQQGSNCRAWLFQICKNSYINDFRRKKYETVPVDFQNERGSITGGPEDDQVYSNHASPVDESFALMERDLLTDEVASALGQLSPEYQTALILSDVEGFTYEEIAAFTRAPIGTVRSRIHRARKLLAQRLARYARELGYAA